jgi:hypothetical protein
VISLSLAGPDMFVWKLFAESVTSELWKSWASDQETWPGNAFANNPGLPYPLCAKGKPGRTAAIPTPPPTQAMMRRRTRRSFARFPPDHIAAGTMPERIGACCAMLELKSDEFSALLIDARGLWPIAR